MNLIVFSYSGTVSRAMRLMVLLIMGLAMPVLADTVVDFQDQVNDPGNGALPPTNDTYTCADEIYPVQMGMPVTYSSRCSNNDCSIFSKSRKTSTGPIRRCFFSKTRRY
jgi:hypothetical protein